MGRWLRRPGPPLPSGPAGLVSGGSAAAEATTPTSEAASAGGRQWRPTSATRLTRTGCWTANPAATPLAAERLGVLRRAQQRHLGWMEAHDAELRVQERAVAREGAWRRRVDQRALVLDPPGWLVAELGPVPKDPPERAVWRLAAAELEGYRRAYGLNHPPPAKHGFARVARDGQVAAPAMTPTAERTGGAGERRERRGRGDHTNHRGGLGRRPTVAADQRHQVDPDRLLDGQPRRDTPGRRRDWQVARAALEHLAGWSRHHDHRDHRDQQPPNRDRPGRTLGRDLGHQERNGR